ncbi:MAG: IS66 family insertion sequence element accessory protein TnpB [Bacteroidetes bacterium]|nr:IS66 family insertion sequence element accessory protein TnpB [Bacteroidota bacterium]
MRIRGDLVDGCAGGYAPGIDGLSVLVEEALQRSPCSGSAFVFCNRAGNRIKVLLWDGTGVVVPAPLASGTVRLGAFGYGRMELTSSQWEWLIAGVDWRRLRLQSCARRYS